MITYGIKKEVAGNFDAILSIVKDELAKEGFGILTEINISETLKKKLNVSYSKYVILGACNPQFAYAAVQAEKGIGLLLPCNVIVYEETGKIMVAAIRPTVAMSMVENPKLTEIAQEVEEKLQRVIDRVKEL